MYDYAVVGSGMFGATFAWHAAQASKRVLVIDKRPHVGGNCYTYREHGINVHAHGPHIFHTDDKEIWHFVNQFAEFNRYTHRVVASNRGKAYALPINLTTLNQLWGVTSRSEGQRMIEAARVPCPNPRNLEEWALSQVGRELYAALIYGYTKKQWGREPSALPVGIIKRLPIRLTWDSNYFNDRYQGVPIGGYTQLFEGLLEGSDVRLGTDYLSDRPRIDSMARRVVYTGPVDELVGAPDGHLEYRSLDFKHHVFDVEDLTGIAQMNHTGTDVPHTRVVEHKHFQWVNVQKTVVTWETPCAWSPGLERYYPINDDRNNALATRYRRQAEADGKLVCGGRLGRYVYWDMHQAMGAAMALAKKEGLTT